MNIKWSDFKEDCRHLAELIRFKYSNPRLFGVGRDGMFVALQVAHFLGYHQVHMVMNIGGTKGRDSWQSFVDIPGPQDVIIDDIYETGQTYREIRSKWSDPLYVVLYSKKYRKEVPSEITIGRYIVTKEYIQTPWELIQ